MVVFVWSPASKPSNTSNKRVLYCAKSIACSSPAGSRVITTPNILNLRSRLRYLMTGFFNLFGPLPIGDRRLYNPGGHINPINYFYLGHALRETGFVDLRPSVDHYQRRSWLPFVILFLPMKVAAPLLLATREK